MGMISRAASAAAAAGIALALAGCGEQIAEEVVERQVEGALGTAGGDVEIDIDEEGESGSITVEGEDGDATFSFGGSDLPEGFPAELVPDGATIETSSTIASGDGAMDMVSFITDRATDELFDHYVDLLPSLGYTVDQQIENTINDVTSFTVAGSGEGVTITITGTPNQESGGTSASVLLMREGSQ